MSYLGDRSFGRDNNFNLIRLIAAYAVLISHSFPLVGSGEPFSRIGYTLGGIGVDAFFVTSGFLVTGSLMRLGVSTSFLRARALRIFPALAAMAVLTALVLGAAMTTLSLTDYFLDDEVWTFIVKNATIVAGVRYKLPGVFESNHVPFMMNGSIWTLPFEIRCYALVALLYWLCRRAKPEPAAALARLLVCVAILMLLGWLWGMRAGYAHYQTFRLFYLFSSGAVAWICRHRISLAPRFLVGACALVAIVVAQPQWFFFVYPLLVPYIVLWLAYVPSGPIRRFNALGDYSYGIYVYAYPIQQVVVATVPGASPLLVMALAGIASLPLAMLSWHLIESPMLALKGAPRREAQQGHVGVVSEPQVDST
ncbi:MULTISPECIES: acyltransferase family protein [Lysobacteraceae]|nr:MULTISPECIES: acyltransferase [Lysobacter]